MPPIADVVQAAYHQVFIGGNPMRQAGGFVWGNDLGGGDVKEEVTPTKQSLSAASQDPKTPLESRISVFGNKWAGSTDGEWCYYEGAGWVCETHENSRFSKYYAQCVLSARWAQKESLANTIVGSRVSEKAAKEAGWLRCTSTGRWGTPDEMVQAIDGNNGRLTTVSKHYVENNGGLATCDVSKQTNYIPTTLVRVLRSERFRHVSAQAMKSSGLFSMCGHCRKVYERNEVIPRLEAGGEIMCTPCVFPYQKKHAIMAHNAKDYPKPIIGLRTRLGSKLGADGLLYSTKEKESVPVLRLFGTEAEVEINVKSAKRDEMTRLDLALHARNTLGHDFVMIKEDGTLTTNGKYSDREGEGTYYAGFEIVSAPCDIDTQRARWMRLLDMPGYKNLRAWDTDTCGFHVHVSRESLTSLQISRILVFINSGKTARFIQKIAGRGSDRYCRYYAKTMSDSLHPERVISPDEHDDYNRSRRVAVNLSNAKTIEFRIFRGTINPKHIIRNIEFVDAVCDYCYPSSRSLKDYNAYRPFVAYVSEHRKKWPMLAAWFAHHGMIKSKDILPKLASTHREKMTLRPELVEEPEIKSEGDSSPEATLIRMKEAAMRAAGPAVLRPKRKYGEPAVEPTSEEADDDGTF